MHICTIYSYLYHPAVQFKQESYLDILNIFTRKITAILYQQKLDVLDCFRTFKIFDDDGNKRLNKEEFKWGLRDYGISADPNQQGLSDGEIMELFNELDTDGTGSLSFDEFLNRFQVSPVKFLFDQKNTMLSILVL